MVDTIGPGPSTRPAEAGANRSLAGPFLFAAFAFAFLVAFFEEFPSFTGSAAMVGVAGTPTMVATDPLFDWSSGFTGHPLG